MGNNRFVGNSLGERVSDRKAPADSDDGGSLHSKSLAEGVSGVEFCYSAGLYPKFHRFQPIQWLHFQVVNGLSVLYRKVKTFDDKRKRR